MPGADYIEKHRKNGPMSWANRWWLIRGLILLMALNGCDTGGQSVRPWLPENGRFIDMWNTYTHCYRSEDLDAVHLDARQLNHAAGAISAAADPILSPFDDPAHKELPVRASVDPAAMAAACTLRAGQIAQGTGHPHLAQEMFLIVITNFPQPPYRYYVAQAQRGLELLDVPSHSTFSSPPM